MLIGPNPQVRLTADGRFGVNKRLADHVAGAAAEPQ